MTPQDFVAKWRGVSAKETAAYAEHFIDVCRLIGHPTPLEADRTGTQFAFQAGVKKPSGEQGFADVSLPGKFAWEYKGPHANLSKAYAQLLQYRESLHNPPLLIVSDLATIEIHTNFTNSVKKVYGLALEDLLTPNGLKTLRAAFYEPETLKAAQTVEDVTQEVAAEFARLAEQLRRWKVEPEPAAHFLIRLLFCLFAEDVGLLPNKLFSKLVESGRRNPKIFHQQLRQLFTAMAEGGPFGADVIPHFNGGLFDDAAIIELDSDALDMLARVSKQDWGSIEPSIFGTLFERSLDPGKRAQLGAHYTDKGDILLIVEPVLMQPLRRRWAEIKAEAVRLKGDADKLKGKAQERARGKLAALFTGFAQEIASTKVLDPACGSGNFLYVSLRALLDLEKEVISTAAELGVGRFFPSVSPAQLYGIELNPYAHELAQTTVWIGYIQWLSENGFGFPAEPILKPLHNIQHMDAIMDLPPGNPSARSGQVLPATEPEWPEADVIVGNPPFLGGNRIRGELGDEYVDALFKLYEGRVPAFADLVCYWFEKARAMVEAKAVKRVGLLATQAIRGGANRRILEHIKESGDIFWAQSDREWVLNGAMVHVSMIAFDNGSEVERYLDGNSVSQINADLTVLTDLTQAFRLMENQEISFQGPSPKAKFDIKATLAKEMLNAPININGKRNSDVVRVVIGSRELTNNVYNKWTIDFGLMGLDEAAEYELPFEYVRKHVYPVRIKNRRESYAKKWWQYAEARPGMRNALKKLNRYIATPAHSKHRLFIWVEPRVLCNQALFVFARQDDYFFGVLHSKAHELWARGTGTQLREAESGFRYTPSSTFETFPFPWPPGQEPQDDARVQAIASAAKALVEQRDAWLNPQLQNPKVSEAFRVSPNDAPPTSSAGISEAELKKRTLTNLYNAKPQWLLSAHRKLDEAVFAAYGWPPDLTDDEILARLLALNLDRSGNNRP